MADSDSSDAAGPVVDPDLPDPLTEAEQAASDAESRAEEARARAAALRQQAEAADADDADADDADEDTDADGDEAAPTDPEPEPAKARFAWLPQWLRRPPSPATARIAGAIVLIVSSLAASGYMVWHHIALDRDHTRAAEFAAAARTGIRLMMTLDPDHAREDIQRLIDDTTGTMQSQLRVTSTMMVEEAKKAQVRSTATTEDVAVTKMTDNSAVVLLIAKSDTTNPDKSKRPPAYWRLSIELTRDGGQLKMSKVDFLQ